MPLALRYTGGDALDLYGYFLQHVDKEATRILEAPGEEERTHLRSPQRTDCASTPP
ncbi:MAG: hypothetical protein IPN62_08805 [Flavobacteriales bacterium]|nr:hypothetical protein [Flavobacteriales bacterium]